MTAHTSNTANANLAVLRPKSAFSVLARADYTPGLWIGQPSTTDSVLVKVTFFEEGQAAMNSQLQVVATQFAGHRGFGRVAIHRYNAAYLSGLPNWPLPGQ